MKLIVFLILISNIGLAQDILVPRNIVESCRENYDIIFKQKEIILNKDSIINNRDSRINLDNIHISKLVDNDSLNLIRISNTEAIVENKEKEIKNIKKSNKKVLILIGVLEILKDVALIILFL